MTTLTTERRCLTCGGPAVLCMQADRCVGLDNTALRPPAMDGAPARARGSWRVVAAVSFVVLLLGALIWLAR
jgi:hypothetical protein